MILTYMFDPSKCSWLAVVNGLVARVVELDDVGVAGENSLRNLGLASAYVGADACPPDRGGTELLR